MQIQLKQSEITDALKRYITSQGFNLAGKSVNVTFTAGRGEAGLSADMVIEAATGLPVLDSDDETGVEQQQSERPALTVVTNATEAKPEAPAADVPASKASSLFN